MRTENWRVVVGNTGTYEYVLWTKQQNCWEKSFLLCVSGFW